MAHSTPPLMRKKPSAVRSPVMKAWSRSSTSAVSSLALSASVRATSTVGTSITSAARRAATSERMNCWSARAPCRPCARTSSPSELVLEVHAGGARLDHGLHQLEGVERPAEAGLGVGHDGREPVALAPPSAVLDLVGALQRLVDALDHAGTLSTG
jgi:hypothetical protein